MAPSKLVNTSTKLQSSTFATTPSRWDSKYNCFSLRKLSFICTCTSEILCACKKEINIEKVALPVSAQLQHSRTFQGITKQSTNKPIIL